LESSEGGDEISDDEIMQRFVTPYTELGDDATALIKRGHVVKMTDDNGKSLEFVVTHVELEGASPEDEAEEGNYRLHTRMVKSCRYVFNAIVILINVQIWTFQ
jgi:hypothetical protein